MVIIVLVWVSFGFWAHCLRVRLRETREAEIEFRTREETAP